MNSIGLTITVLLSLTVLVAPRVVAALAVMAGVCYVTQGQQYYVISFHFTAIRIIVLAGIVRSVLRGGFRGLQFNNLDKVVIGYAISLLCIYTARERTTDALVYMLGCAYDIILPYFCFRCLLTNLEDAQAFVRGLAFLIIPYALLLILESVTYRNPFSSMGGQGWDEIVMREGRIRCVAGFRGPHTAGFFGATLIPLFFALWFGGKARFSAIVGMAAGLIVVYTTNSSGPLTAFVSGVFALLFWRFRYDMQLVRRGIVISLIGLHLIMKAPVWYIFYKISHVLGGDGWTRSYVIDLTIRHFFEWFLLGTKNTLRWVWDDPTLVGETDLTDQFVGTALSGGLLSLIFFILIFSRGYQRLGLAMNAAREHSAEAEKFLWCVGATLFGHIMAQFSCGYFDQMGVAWWGFIALIAGATSGVFEQATDSEAADLAAEAAMGDDDYLKRPA